MSSCPLSVVMPVYNEAAVLTEVLAGVQRDVLDLVPGSELVVVNDHSTDGTADVLSDAARLDSRIRVLFNEANSGHGISVRRGLDGARGEWIFQIDSDAQVDLTQFARFWNERESSDLLMGVRIVRHDPRHRLVLTRVTRVLVSVLARRWLRDANVPFKLFRAELFHSLQAWMPPRAFAPSILLAMGAARSGARITETEIRHLPRTHGQSTLRLFRLARACGLAGWQTLRCSAARVPQYRSGGTGP